MRNECVCVFLVCSYIPVDGGEERVPFDLLHSVGPGPCRHRSLWFSRAAGTFRLLSFFLRGSHIHTHTHTALAREMGFGGVWGGFPRHVMPCGCQNATSLGKVSAVTRGVPLDPLPLVFLSSLSGANAGLPSLLAGFRLNSILSKLWASRLRNWGIPSFALEQREGKIMIMGDYGRKLISTKLSAHKKKTHFRIMFIVSLRSFPWNGNVPVSISN